MALVNKKQIVGGNVKLVRTNGLSKTLVNDKYVQGDTMEEKCAILNRFSRVREWNSTRKGVK